MITAVDSAVLIDVLQDEPAWASRSADALDAAQGAGRLIASEIVWAEVSGRFPSSVEAARALNILGIEFVSTGQPRLWTPAAFGGSFARREASDATVSSPTFSSVLTPFIMPMRC